MRDLISCFWDLSLRRLLLIICHCLNSFFSLYWNNVYAITFYFVKCWLTNRLYFLFFSGIQMLNLLVPILVDCLLELPDSANKHSKALHENCLLVLKQIGPQYPLVRNCFVIISMLSFCDLTPKKLTIPFLYLCEKTSDGKL